MWCFMASENENSFDESLLALSLILVSQGTHGERMVTVPRLVTSVTRAMVARRGRRHERPEGLIVLGLRIDDCAYAQHVPVALAKAVVAGLCATNFGKQPKKALGIGRVRWWTWAP